MQESGYELTELEGAILSEIYHRKRDTAFQIRRAFQVSPSLEWSGSAGAVYPAIKRLEKRELLSLGEPEGGRKTVRLKVTPVGKAALIDWACDPMRAASVGLDPFRLRSGIWGTLGRDKRLQTYHDISASIQENIDFLQDYVKTLDDVERARVQLSIEYQNLRLRWLALQLKSVKDSTAGRGDSARK